jgi:hypothetical protein
MALAKHAATKTAKLLQVPEALQASIASTKAEFRQLGRSGLRVSNPIFGGLQVGSSKWFPWVLEEEQVCLAIVIQIPNLPSFD